jgi:hypothetical protein
MVLLLVKQLFESRLLFRAALEHKEPVLDGHGRQNKASIKLRPGKGMGIASENSQPSLVDALGYQGRDLLCLPHQTRSRHQNKNQQ